jgi:hypothetical protein
VLLILADGALANARDVRRLALPVVVWGFVLAVCLMPFAVQVSTQANALGRIADLAVDREKALEHLGMTSAQAYREAVRLVPIELYQYERASDREALRPGKGALDPVLAAASLVGFLWCVARFHRSRAARLCLLGFLLFLVPALRSFPADGLTLVPRRMIGSILFLTWLAASGPHALLSSVLPRRLADVAIVGAAIASMALNLYYIRTSYIPRQWYGEYGVEREHVLRAMWEGGREGRVFLRASRNLSLGITLPYDELFVSFVPVGDPEQLRRALAEDGHRVRSVILPAHTKFDRDEDRRWIDALSDVVPPSAWRPGPADLSGEPMYFVARLPP